MKRSKRPLHPWMYGLILVCILAAGAYLRLVGLDWDEEQHLHPDERFLTMVEAAIEPVDSLGDYFDTANSSLNPHNRGYGFFVYGTLPIFIVRYVAEWMGNTGYGEVYLVGRALSALADLLVVLLVYLVAQRLYDRRVGLLAAAFSACAVLQIQLSHFFTVDTFTSLFMLLAVYFAVGIMTANRRPPKMRVSESASQRIGESASRRISESANDDAPPSTLHAPRSPLHPPLFWSFVLFGLALGMAVASKINA
ncbi:MAG: glycosyltransferase family 39 protein, partial [Chloroflexi bacterium]|nr:glycosyltransferase family 39 protein [Chloroflexota bacterium]